MKSLSETLAAIHRKPGRWTVAGLPEGADSLALAELARTTGGQDILHVARDGQRLERLQDGLRFFAPEREVLVFPAWDCLPYDRLSPHPNIVAERLETLARLAAPRKAGAPARVVLASVGAALQKVPPRSLYAEAAVVLRKGQTLDVAWLTKFLNENGYGRSETVMEPGEFAVRGGLVDLFPPGTSEPLRLDLFGDTLADSLGSATIQFQLNGGTVIVATFENGLGRHGNGDMDVMARPNPLNPRTVLTFTLSRPGRVQVAVYDLQGRLVNKLSDQVRSAGPQSLVWDGSNSRNARVSSGVYFFRIQAPEGQVVQRVAVVK